MKAERILEALAQVEEKYIEEAIPLSDGMVDTVEETANANMIAEQEANVEPANAQGKHRTAWRKWCMTAACLCLVVYAGARVLSRGMGGLSSSNTVNSSELVVIDYTSGEEASGTESSVVEPSDEMEGIAAKEKHSILEDIEVNVWGGGGGILLYDIAEYDNGSPWTPEWELDTLPIYRNLAYYDDSGVPVYLDEEELLRKAEKIATALGTTITETKVNQLKDFSRAYGEDESPVRLIATTDLATIEIEADGTGIINFTEAVRLPEGYRFSGYETSDEEVEKSLQYLTERFGNALEIEDAVVYSSYDYYTDGTRNGSYYAYEQGTTKKESLINYSFGKVRFYPGYGEENAVSGIRFHREMGSVEYLGEYPIMKPQEAKELLLEGQFYSSTMDPKEIEASLTSGTITEPTMEYRVYNSIKIFIPYYVFYAELPEEDYGPEVDENLKRYGIYYVPAIQQEYWDEIAELLETYFGE